MTFKQSILEEFEKKLTLGYKFSELKDGEINFTLGAAIELRDWLSSALDQVIARTDKWLPEEIIDDGKYYSTEYKNGWNDCLEKVSSNKQKDLDNK